MKKSMLSVLSVLAGIALFAVVANTAQAGPPTPLGVAEAKRAAKKYIHSYCNTHNCRGSRIKKCDSKTQFRVDCEGLYGKGAKDVCTFKITVLAVKDRQLRFSIRNVKCKNF